MEIQLYHIVTVGISGAVMVETIESPTLEKARGIATLGSSTIRVLAVFGEHNLDQAAEIAHHAQTAINAYKDVQAYLADSMKTN